MIEVACLPRGGKWHSIYSLLTKKLQNRTVKKNGKALSVEIDEDEEQDNRETKEDTVPPRADPVKENKPKHDKKKKV